MVLQYYSGNLTFPLDYERKSRTALSIQSLVYENVEKLEEGIVPKVPMYVLLDSKSGEEDTSTVWSLDESVYSQPTPEYADACELEELRRFRVMLDGKTKVNVENPSVFRSCPDDQRSDKVKAYNKNMISLLGKHNEVVIRDLSFDPYSVEREGWNLSDLMSPLDDDEYV
jgi:hypothetical protein